MPELLRFACGKCGARLVASAKAAGRSLACPKCKSTVIVAVPTPPGQRPPPAAAPATIPRTVTWGFLLGGISGAVVGVVAFAALPDLGPYGPGAAMICVTVAMTVGALLGAILFAVIGFARCLRRPREAGTQRSREVTAETDTTASSQLRAVDMFYHRGCVFVAVVVSWTLGLFVSARLFPVGTIEQPVNPLFVHFFVSVASAVAGGATASAFLSWLDRRSRRR